MLHDKNDFRRSLQKRMIEIGSREVIRLIYDQPIILFFAIKLILRRNKLAEKIYQARLLLQYNICVIQQRERQIEHEHSINGKMNALLSQCFPNLYMPWSSSYVPLICTRFRAQEGITIFGLAESMCVRCVRVRLCMQSN